MSYNGSGTYQLPSGNPVSTGATISSTWANTTLSDIASGLTNALCKDGQSTPTANIKMGGFKHTNLGSGSAATDSANLGQVQAAAYALLGSVSGTDTITAAGSPAVTAYAAGQTFRFVSAGANTGAVTLNIDSLGAKSITKNGTTALAAGDIPSGAVCEVVYDGTQFQLIGVVADRIKRSGDTMTGALNAAATATVASATTCDIGAASSSTVIISGTTTITNLGTIAAGAVRDVTFSGALTLTHNATSLILPTGANITTAAGDTATFVSLGSGNWRCVSYQRATGQPLQSEYYVYVRDEKASGTAGGSASATTWNSRNLNTEVSDVAGIATVASNQVTLAAGTYRFRASAPAYLTNGHKLRLQNVTDGTTIAVGTSETAASGTNVQNRSFVSGRFTIAAGKALELQHYTVTAAATNGLGLAVSAGVNEVYAEVEFWKEF